jgi:hypothetical protein
MGDIPGQQDTTGTGAEGWFFCEEALKGLKQAIALKKL